jgi:hypothetical protein
MKFTHLFATTTIAFGLASSALAATNIYIAGAPAIRQPLTTAIEALVDAGGGTVTRAYNGSNIITANVVEWENATIAGNSVNIYLTYNGSAGGYQATAGNKKVRFLNANLSGGGQNDVLSNTGSAQEVVPHFHIANEFQVSTPWNGTNDLAYPEEGPTTYASLNDRINGILPLRLVASPAAPANLNITPQLVQTLYGAGVIRLSQLTGNSADFNKKVYPLSRGIDSGIRTLWATNNGYGATTEILGWQASVSLAGGRPVVGIVPTSGGSGYIGVPTVGISGGGGSGATATAVLTGDKVTSIIVNTPGSGYTSAPSITITPTNGGKLAAATAVIGGGSVTSHVLYPSGRVIGVDYGDGNGGYPTFGPLLTALTATLNLPGGNAGDIYFTVLSDADAQVAFAAGAKEVSWNGNKLGTLGTYGNSAGINTGFVGGTSSPALSNGQYELWGYVRLASRTTLAGVPLAVRNAISDRLKNFDSPVLLKDVNVQRSAPDGGAIIQGQISVP